MLILAKNTFSVNRVQHFLQINHSIGVFTMTISQLKQLIQTLPDDTPIILSTDDVYETETAMVEYHSDGRVHLVLSNLE